MSFKVGLAQDKITHLSFYILKMNCFVQESGF